MYDMNTKTVTTESLKCLEPGDVKTLSNLNLAVSAYSNNSIAQDFYWQSNNAQAVSVDSSTGTVTAVSTGIAVISGRVYRAGQYHYVTYTVNVGYPELFGELVSMGCMDASKCDQTGDGFYMSMTPLSDVLTAKEITALPKNSEATENNNVAIYYDDWYIYAVCDGMDVSYSLVNLREIENDDVDTDTPGVTVSFISFDKAVLQDCLTSPTIANKYSLFVALAKVIGPEVVQHDDVLAEYFAETAFSGAYLIAEKFVYIIAETAINNEIIVPENCMSIFATLADIEIRLLDPTLDEEARNYWDALYMQYNRIPWALVLINLEAESVIFNEDKGILSVTDITSLSLLEKQAILCCYSANVTFNSFAAEVEYHADMAINVEWPEFVYSSAIRADMAVGEEIESGGTDLEYYNLSSPRVQAQIAVHGEY